MIWLFQVVERSVTHQKHDRWPVHRGKRSSWTRTMVQSHGSRITDFGKLARERQHNVRTLASPVCQSLIPLSFHFRRCYPPNLSILSSTQESRQLRPHLRPTSKSRPIRCLSHLRMNKDASFHIPAHVVDLHQYLLDIKLQQQDIKKALQRAVPNIVATPHDPPS